MVPGLVHRRPCHIDLSLFSITGVVCFRVFKPAICKAGTAASLAGASYGHPEEGSASGVRQTTLSEDRHQTKTACCMEEGDGNDSFHQFTHRLGLVNSPISTGLERF